MKPVAAVEPAQRLPGSFRVVMQMVQSALSGSSNPGTAPIPSGGTVRQRLSTSLRGSLDSNFRLASSKARYAMYMRFSVWCIISTMVLLHS